MGWCGGQRAEPSHGGQSLVDLQGKQDFDLEQESISTLISNAEKCSKIHRDNQGHETATCVCRNEWADGEGRKAQGWSLAFARSFLPYCRERSGVSTWQSTVIKRQKCCLREARWVERG